MENMHICGVDVCTFLTLRHLQEVTVHLCTGGDSLLWKTPLCKKQWLSWSQKGANLRLITTAVEDDYSARITKFGRDL